MERFTMEPAKIQSAAKSIYKDIDLYGVDTLLNCLRQYSHVSWMKNSNRKSGSQTKQSCALREGTQVEIQKLICHKDGKTTIKTDKGFLQFLNI